MITLLVILSGLLGSIVHRKGLMSHLQDSAHSEGAHAVWKDAGETVAEQFGEADVVIRARVKSLDETRALVRQLPVSGKAADDMSDKVVSTGKYVTSVMPFTDANVKVLEVYKGELNAGDEIKVMQTGGKAPATENYRRQNVELAADPLFEVGGEHILFLINISGDEIHAPDRKLYTINTPLGRYDIEGHNVVNHSGREELNLPATLEQLVERLRQATKHP